MSSLSRLVSSITSTTDRVRCTFRRIAQVSTKILAQSLLVTLAVSSAAQAHLFENFDRADNAAIGNNWIEKSPNAFSLAGNQVTKQAVGTWYRDNVVYRPNTEDVLNAEASLEFRMLSLPPGYPQIFVRLQSATVATTNVLDGYMLYFPDSASSAVLGRQNADNFVTTLATLNLSQPLNTTDRYRMRMSATGTNPVALEAYIERLVGSVWTVIGQATANDAAANRIATAGSVAFGGYVEAAYTFDNFTRVDLGAAGTTNPAPTAVQLAPASASAGESGLLLVVYGSGFTTDSVVRWNGSNRTTTYVSPSELEAQITAADLATTGTRPVTVFNPTPGGGTTAALNFQVNNPVTPAPTTTSLSPNSASAGGAGFTLTVNGTNFNAGSVVRWNGANRTTTFVNASQLTATITAADIAAVGSAAVTVFRASDSLTSNAQTFTINTPPTPMAFTDNFNRADATAIGNGWLEKTDAAFTIASNEAAKQVVTSGYRENIVYRPAAENILDVEASIELRFTSAQPGYPQLFVRLNTTTITTPDQLEGYMLYVEDNASRVILGRQSGNQFVTGLATILLTTPFNTTDRFRLRMSATGTNPVTLFGYVERFNGTSWDVIGQGSASDATAQRLATAGSVGFGGYIEGVYRFDNFSRAPVTGPINPVPATSGLSPNTATAGSAAMNITVNGSNFINGSTVRWNGSNRTTTFVSASQLTAQITAADLATAGSGSVTVFTASPGGGTSNAQTFTITTPTTNPVPVAAALNPSSALVGGSGFTLTVTGSGFVNGSVVRWNGSNRTTTFISGGELQATIASGDISTTGNRTVTVFSPTPGGGTSNGLTFSVTSTNPVPVANSLSPSSATAGSAAFTLTVLGSNFINGSTVRWNGSNRTTTFISAGELRANIAASDIVSTGSANVTVFTPTPGGGTSNTRTFTISSPGASNPAPVLTSISTNRAAPGSGPVVVTVTGSGFNSNSIVRWNGADRATTLVNGTTLQATIASGDLANAGLGTIAVFNPTPGGGTSTPATFFVQAAELTLFVDDFNRADNEVVGNGWTEKNPNAFFIQGNVAASRDTSSGFPQDIMFRSDTRLDMETSVEFIRQVNNPNVLEEANFPQVHGRLQLDQVTTAYSINSYIFFIEDVANSPGRAIFAINRAPPLHSETNECYIAPLPLPEALVTGQRYRLRLRVSGTSPVTLTGYVDRYDNGNWTLMTSGTTTHSASTVRDPALFCERPNLPPPITNAGVAGIAKWVNRSDLYDNFYVRDLQAGAAVPVINLLSPQSANSGGTAFQLTVNGSGFAANSVVRWNGSSRTTTFVNSTQIRANITAADIAAAGAAMVTVFNPTTSTTSEAVSFQISPPAGTQTLFDQFTRADGATIGNGWIEKNAAAFSINAGRALKLSTPGTSYLDNIVYRPSNEDTLNVEASAEFRLLGTPVGYPELIVRLQAATAATPGAYDGYLLYFADSTSQAMLSRQNGSSWDTALATVNLSTPLNTTDTYRMRLSAVGSSPVVLQAFIERLNGATWQVIGSANVNDNAADRIQGPGSVGFGGYTENTYAFDNFRRIEM
jgi:hypothetical protein